MLKKTFFAAFLAAALLAGCSGQQAPKTHQPAAIGAHDRCHLCGMVIVHYEGPKAQIFIKDVEEPLKFCSGRDAFTFALQPENARRLEGFFIHLLRYGIALTLGCGEELYYIGGYPGGRLLPSCPWGKAAFTGLVVR